MPATAKDTVRDLLDKLPDDVSYEDIQYRIYVRQKIENSLQAVREGRVLTQEEVPTTSTIKAGPQPVLAATRHKEGAEALGKSKAAIL